MNNVSAVVVTYNKKDYLRATINALLNQTAQLSIVIVDNNSDDGTAQMISNEFDNESIYYFNTGSNLGGAGGFNYGLKKAYELGFDYYWLMDDDAEPKNDALESILKSIDYLGNEFGFICSNVRWIDNSACRMNIPQLTVNWLNEDDLVLKGLIPVDIATFVGFFVPKKVVEEVGLPIKDFFIWSDDANYSIRISKRYPCFLCLDSRIIHHMKMNSAADIVNDNSGREKRYYYAFRNRLYNARLENRLKNYFLNVLIISINLIVKPSKNKLSKIRYMYKGIVAGLFFNPEIEYVK